MNIAQMPIQTNMTNNVNHQNTYQKRDDNKANFAAVMDQTKMNPQQESKPIKDVSKKEIPAQVTSKDVTQLKETTTKTIAESEDEILEYLAGQLEIHPQELEAILAALQINISDLLLTGNLQQLIMAVYKVEDPVDLLGVPDIGEKIEGITAVLEGYRAQLSNKTDLQMVSQENVALATDQKDTNQFLGQVEYLDGETGKAKALPKSNQESDTDILIPVKDSHSAISIQDGEELSSNQQGLSEHDSTGGHEFFSNLTHAMGEAFQAHTENSSHIDQMIKSVAQPLEPQVVLDQIVERIKVSVIEEEANMQIQLKPEHLGKLSMEVISKQGVLTAQFTVESQKVKEMMEQNIQNLQEALEDKGLIIDQLEVTVGEHQEGENQSYTSSKSDKNISDMISRIMNEDDEESQVAALPKSENSEVDFIA